jgi:hypothetical protein
VYGEYAGFDDDIALEIKPNDGVTGWSVKRHKYYPLADKKPIDLENNKRIKGTGNSYFTKRNIGIIGATLAVAGLIYYLYKKYYLSPELDNNDEAKKE